jgi:hypothetical protein
MTPRTVHLEPNAGCDKPSYQTCAHPKSAQRAGVVPPIAGDLWSLEALDHVWVACAACGQVLRTAPYADELEAEAARGLPRPAPATA